MSAPPQRILCPYCGTKTPATEERCGACGGFFDELSRRVTQQHMGPWFIREPEQPFRPGCSFTVIAKQVERGKITTKTVLKGPSTRQFWAMAANVPGVANLLGVCHSCSTSVSKIAQSCPTCGAAFPKPDGRDELGLDAEDSGVFEEAERAAQEFAAQQEIERKQQIAAQQAAATAAVKPSSPPAITTPPAGTAPQVPSQPASPAAAQPAAAAAVTAPPPAQPASPQLDNISWMSGESGQAEVAEPAASGGGATKWIVALVGVNVALALAVVAILVGDPGEPNEPGDNPIDEPPIVSPGDNDPAPGTGTGPVAVANPNDPGPKPIDPGTTGTPGTGTVVGPGETVTIPGPSNPTPTDPPDPPDPGPGTTTLPNTGTTTDPIAGGTDTPSGGVSFFGIEAAPGAPTVSQAQIKQLEQRFEEANQLAIAGQWPQALKKLEDLKSSMPKGVKSDTLDVVIDQVREKVKEMKKVDDFFDG